MQHDLFSFKPIEVRSIFRQAILRTQRNGLEFIVAAQAKDFGRLLVVTPRRIGNAPKRNRIRRRLKEIFYQHNFFIHGYDIIVLVKKESIHLNFKQLEELMLELFVRLKK